MSIYNAIANAGSNVGEGLNAFVKGNYMVREDQRRNALAAEEKEYARRTEMENRNYLRSRDAAADKRQATADQMRFGQETLSLLQSLPENQREAAYMARVEEAARTVGLPENFNPAEGFQKTLSMLAPPKPGAGFTLNPGATRYDAEGNVIASAPRAPGVVTETPDEKRKRDNAAALALAQEKAKIVPPAVKAKAADKLRAANAIRQQLGKVQKAFDGIKETLAAGGMGQTWLGALTNPEAGQKFDAAVAALAPFIRQMTRTPGEGSMSDYESRLAAAINPDRTNFEGVTQQQIDDLYDLVETIELGYREISGESPSPVVITGADEQVGAQGSLQRDASGRVTGSTEVDDLVRKYANP